MKEKNLFLTLSIILLLTACGKHSSEELQSPDTIGPMTEVTSMVTSGSSTEDLAETTVQDSENKSQRAEELLDEFLAGNIMASYVNSDREPFYITDLPMNEEDFFSYSVGGNMDLDNDGELELILDGAYGGIYLDARDNTVYVLAEGLGTAEILSYTTFDEQTWIVHSDTIHSGRYLYSFTRYDGSGAVQDTFLLTQEFWETPDMPDGPDTVYTYRDEKITREEFMALREKMLHIAAP